MHKKIVLIAGILGVFVFGTATTLWLSTPWCFEINGIKLLSRLLPFALSLISAGVVGIVISDSIKDDKMRKNER